jgi:seryl-tRNA synthetase
VSEAQAMTATYNPAEVERLIAEARAFGARDRQGLREAMANQLEAAKVAIENLTGMERAANAIRLAESRAVLQQEQVDQQIAEANAKLQRILAEQLEASRASTATLADQLEAAKAKIEELRAMLPNWSHAEALQQRDALIAGSVAAEAEIGKLRGEVERMRPVFDASLAMRAADRGDAIRNDMSIAEAEAIAAENRSGRALMRWRNAVDAVLPDPNAGTPDSAGHEPSKEMP